MNAPSNDSFIPTIIFHDSKSTFNLYGTVHSQQCSMNTFQVFDYFPMHCSQFPIDPYRSVFICFFTSFSIWTSTAVFALIQFFLAPVRISPHRLAVQKMKRLIIWASHYPIFINSEIHSAEWIFMIFLILCFFLEHRKLHIFFNPILFAENIVIVESYSASATGYFG